MEMKKILSLIIALALLIGCINLTFISSAENEKVTVIRPIGMPTELNAEDIVIETINPGTAGGSGYTYEGCWWGGYSVNNNNPVGKVTLSTSKAYMPFTNVNLKLDSTVAEFDRVTNEYDYARKGIAFNLKFTPNEIKALKDATGIMIYVKMPTTTAQFAPYYITKNSNSWNLRSKSNGELYTLERGSSVWIKKEMPGDSEIIELPKKGFEGYVFIPKASLSIGDNTDWETDYIQKLQIQFGRFGGDEGPVYFSAPIITATNPLNSDNARMVKVDGENEIKDIFTGKPFSEDKEQSIKNASYINPIELVSDSMGYLVGNSIAFNKSNGGIELSVKDSETAKDYTAAVTDGAVGFLGGGNAITLNSANAVTDNNFTTEDDSVSLFKIRCFENFAVKDSENGAIMLYLKMPKAADGKEVSFKPSFITNGDDEGKSATATVYENKKFYYLAKNGEDWIDAKSAGGAIILPSEFEGYVRIPWQSIKKINKSISNGEVVSEIDLSISTFGGEYGGITLGALAEATNNIISKKSAVILNTEKVINIFDGSEVDKSTLDAEPMIQEYDDSVADLKPGDILTKLDDASDPNYVINEINEDDINQNSAFISWTEYPGAKSYVVNIFKYGLQDDEYIYTFISSITTTDAFSIINGLETETRYAVQVKALGTNKVLATYEYDSFYTVEASSIIGDLIDFTPTYETVEYEVEDIVPKLGDTVPLFEMITALILSAFVLGAVILIKKKIMSRERR